MNEPANNGPNALKQLHPAAAEDGKRRKTIPGTPLKTRQPAEATRGRLSRL
jgi:hypothetical protein